MRNHSLDGLRGIAVILVILYHHGYLNSGWLGVDLFFVLSGYLITKIIWKTREDRFFWREFWIKRATRILPPFLLLLITSYLFFPITALQAVGYLFSLGDVFAYTRPNLEVLRPLWSLAVEEHFYILWPFAVRLMTRRHLLYLLTFVILAEPVLRGIGIVWVRDWQFVYFLTPFRLDGLSLGCLLALAMESPQVVALATRWSGLAILAPVSIFVALRIALGHEFVRESPTVVYSSLCYSLVALTACLVLAYLLTHPRSVAARAFGWRPLAFVGTISYGLYLYHVLLREILTSHFGFTLRNAIFVDVPVVFAIAWLSFRYYESPLIAWGRRLSESYRHESQESPAA